MPRGWWHNPLPLGEETTFPFCCVKVIAARGPS
ncbi:hypothetical protein [Stutzerimonas tarimensis]|uniref:Uncharacterized protein n=1 Tax=Stutzerimonas tarimensis TaxID=1507735 RepID=A0ABV7T354_9GAMM